MKARLCPKAQTFPEPPARKPSDDEGLQFENGHTPSQDHQRHAGIRLHRNRQKRHEDHIKIGTAPTSQNQETGARHQGEATIAHVTVQANPKKIDTMAKDRDQEIGVHRPGTVTAQ